MKKGFVSFVVLTFAVFSTLISTGMYSLSKHNINNQAAFFQKMHSVEGAESGIIYFEYLLNKHPDKILSFLQTYSDKEVWYNGSNDSWEWSETQSKSVQISKNDSIKLKVSNIDTTSGILTLTIYSQGLGGSKKTLHAILKIEGIGKVESPTKTFDNYVKHALYVENDMQSVNEFLDITGDLYSGGKTIFNDGSKVNGNVKILNRSGTDVIINDNVYFNGNVYIQGDAVVNQNLTATGDYFYIQGRTALNNTTTFTTNTYLAGGFTNINGEMTFNKYGYVGGEKFNINKKVTVNQNLDINTDIINFNDQMIVNNGTVNFKYDESKALQKGKIVLNNNSQANMNQIIDIPLPEKLGINTQKEEEVSINEQNLVINFKLSDIDKQANDPNFYNNNFRNSFSPDFWEDLAKDGVAIYKGKVFTAYNLEKNNGILVVLVDKDIGNFQYGDFNEGNIIFVVENATMNAGNNFWNIKNPATDINFSISNGQIIPTSNFNAEFKILGTHVYYHNDYQMPITGSIAHGNNWETPWGSYFDPIDGNLNNFVNNKYTLENQLANTPLYLAVKSWYKKNNNWYKYIETYSNDNSGQIITLKNNDPLPNATLFQNPDFVQDYIKSYIDIYNGTVSLENNQILYLCELNSTDPNTSDYQDLAILVSLYKSDNNQSPITQPSIGIIVKNNGKLENFGGNGMFRGFVWDSSSTRGNYSTFKDGIYGSLIIKGKHNFNINNGPGNGMKIVYNEDAIMPFTQLGIFTLPGESSTSTAQTTTSNTTAQIYSIKATILSKY